MNWLARPSTTQLLDRLLAEDRQQIERELDQQAQERILREVFEKILANHVQAAKESR